MFNSIHALVHTMQKVRSSSDGAALPSEQDMVVDRQLYSAKEMDEGKIPEDGKAAHSTVYMVM